MTKYKEQKGKTFDSIVYTDFAFDMLRASVFIPEIQSQAKIIYRNLPDDWIEYFDAEPTLIPVPEGAPSSIPIMQLSNKTGERRLGVSRVRVDFELRSLSTEEPIESVEAFYKDAISRLIQFSEIFNITIKRLATNANRFVKQEDPGLYLAQHFCNEKWWLEAPLNRPKQFELSAHKRFNLYEGLEVNSWVRNKTGKSTMTGDSLIIIEQDINTLPEEMDIRKFSKKEIGRFFKHNIKELDHILALYYPSERSD